MSPQTPQATGGTPATPNPLPVTSPPDVQNNSGTRVLLNLPTVGIQPLSDGIAAPGMGGNISNGTGPTGLPPTQNLGSLVSDNNAPTTGSVADGGPSVLAARFQQPGSVS
jgi:hypothetical protein